MELKEEKQTETVNENKKKYVQLTRDPQGPISQRYFCISYLAPERISNLNTRLINVHSTPRGNVFETLEEAKKAAEYLHTLYPNFDVLIGECGEWIKLDFNMNEIQDQKFDNEKQNELHQAYIDNVKKTSEYEEYRKQQMISEYKENEKKNRKKYDASETEVKNTDKETKNKINELRNIIEEQEKIKNETDKLNAEKDKITKRKSEVEKQLELLKNNIDDYKKKKGTM